MHRYQDQDANGNPVQKISVTPQELEQMYKAHRGEQYTMQGGGIYDPAGQLVQAPAPQQAMPQQQQSFYRGAMPQQVPQHLQQPQQFNQSQYGPAQIESMFQAAGGDPYGQMLQQDMVEQRQMVQQGGQDPFMQKGTGAIDTASLQGMGYNDSDPFGDVDLSRNAVRKGRQMDGGRSRLPAQGRAERPSVEAELNEFLSESSIFSKIKSAVPSPKFYEGATRVINGILKVMQDVVPLKSVAIARKNDADFKKRVGEGLIKATELSGLPPEGRAIVWCIHQRVNSQKRFYVICYEGKISFVKEDGGKLTEMFLDAISGSEIEQDDYSRLLLYQEFEAEIANLFGISVEEEDGEGQGNFIPSP